MRNRAHERLIIGQIVREITAVTRLVARDGYSDLEWRAVSDVDEHCGAEFIAELTRRAVAVSPAVIGRQGRH